MKKAVRLSIVLLFAVLLSACTAFAAPKGYQEVKITKKNAKKYFSYKKVKDKDTFGDYAGYDFYLLSKKLKKGYYIYDVSDDFALKVSFKDVYKLKTGKKWHKFKSKRTATVRYAGSYLAGHSKIANYKYGKLKSFKIKKAKGKVIYILPSNVKGVKLVSKSGNYSTYHIMLKYPYNSSTLCKYHYDKNYNRIVDYYYVSRTVSNYKNELKLY